jgi:YD repeat-containing protein
MKKTVILVLALLLALNLAACSVSYGDGEGGFISAERLKVYQKYDELIDYLENQDYQSALAYLVNLAQQEQGTVPTHPPQPTEPSTQPTTQPTEPTVDPALKNRYARATERLQYLVKYYLDDPYNFYVRPAGADKDLRGMEAFAWLYNEFVKLGDYEDSAKYAAGFSSLKNVPLNYKYTLVDHMQNKTDYSNNTHYYDADGKLIRFRGIPQEFEYIYTTGFNTYYYEYDASGKINSVKIMSGDNISVLFTPTYDENGRVISYHFMNTSGEEKDYFYTYDNQGRLIESKIEKVNEGSSITYTYINRVRFNYNEAGLLTEKVYERLTHYDYLDEKREDRTSVSQRYTFTYTYNGTTPAGMTETYQDIYEESQYVDGKYVYTPYVNSTYTHQHTYTCDSQNRIVEDSIVYGNYYDKDGNMTDKWDNVSRTTTYNYGDYWIYTPAE